MEKAIRISQLETIIGIAQRLKSTINFKNEISNNGLVKLSGYSKTRLDCIIDDCLELSKMIEEHEVL